MAEKAVYDNVQSGKDSQTRGKNLYLLFDKVVVLNQIMTQMMIQLYHHIRAPLSQRQNNLKSHSQQEGMWLEAQVTL